MNRLPSPRLPLDHRPSARPPGAAGTAALPAPPPGGPERSVRPADRSPAPASHRLGHRGFAPDDLAWGDAAQAPGHPASRITPSGAEWLTSAAATSPRTVSAWWHSRPGAPGTLPCGTVFDVVSVPELFGRGLLERLWSGGPGSGPVAAHRGRLLLFASVGTARRLPALLRWEEWNGNAGRRGETIPPLLCHGLGDAVTVPPPCPPEGTTGGCRWLVAPDVRRPWLPGPEVLLWAYVRAARSRRHSVTDGSRT